jgi:hypothetical protein
MNDNETIDALKSHPAQWTNDCQGKKDFDGELVTLSTRYWPGSYSRDGQPSARASIHLQGADDEYVELRSEEFSAPTEAEVKEQVERWAKFQWKRLVRVMVAEFGPAKDPS